MGMKAEIEKSHPWLVEWFDKASKDLKAEIIEKCFKKSDNGRAGGKGQWVLDLEKPFFQESKQRCVCECVCAPWEPIEL